ncbi:hypothetical protein HY632_04040 [Candidatus Uhrbacteria bacterium]|nr:hypothetical protein [Candidatus Uhrbacteria bacterium]
MGRKKDAPESTDSDAETEATKETRARKTNGANGHGTAEAHDGGIDEDAFRKVIACRVTCVGISPLLMAAADERKTLEIDGGISEDDKAEKGSSVEAIRRHAKDVVMPRKLYRGPRGIIGIPAENFLECIIQAGVKVKHDKKQLTTGKHTYVTALLEIPEDFLPFPVHCQDQGDGTTGWIPDFDHGWGKTGTFVAIKRPRFDAGMQGWAFQATLVFNPSEIPERVVRDLIAIAGRFVGLGGHRPGKKGKYGKFVIGEWKRLATVPALSTVNVKEFIREVKWPEMTVAAPA